MSDTVTLPENLRSAAAKRLGIGLIQGLIAWALLATVPPWSSYDGNRHDFAGWWSHQHPTAFAVLTLLDAFLPVIALAEIGRMRARRLLTYLVVEAAVLTGVAAYDIWRDPGAGWSGDEAHIWPTFALVSGAGLGCFIVNQLLEHRERGLSLLADYRTHFEDSWMRGFQFVVSLLFTGLFWSVLELGDALFGLIKVQWFGRMIEHDWFRCPVLAMAFAFAVHITDVRPALLRGMRNLGLALLSWLLPLVVALGIAFLIALCTTGLVPLWRTRSAASILLWAVAVTLVLVNAAYKDGLPEHVPPAPLRWAGRAAGPLMLVLALLAVDAIVQRVGQYGWSPQRVRSAAVALVALVYATGYSWATIVRGNWLRPLERVNVAASLVIVAVLTLLLTPVADPARLAVASQSARLADGGVTPERFDYRLLRLETGRYGTNELMRLANSSNRVVAARAKVAQTAQPSTLAFDGGADPARTEPPLAHAAIYPRGAKLPSDFVPGGLRPEDRSDGCLTDGAPCDIIVRPAGARTPALVIVHQTRARSQSWLPADVAFARSPDGKWRAVLSGGRLACLKVLDALRRGEGKAEAPLLDDLVIAGTRLSFTFPAEDATRCPPPPKQVAAPPGDASGPAHMGPAFAGTP